jgi:SAM-dependent methyltransferase
MSNQEHWQDVYGTKSAAEVSWYAPHLRTSLELITAATETNARVIDVGGGASTLVDDLLDLGYSYLTVLDISEAALSAARKRLTVRASSVDWIVSDVAAAEFAKDAFDLWHDRAVFHFMTKEAERQAYLDVLRHSLVANGTVVIATFSLTGPSKCSGLDVVRYSAVSLEQQLGADFELTFDRDETHITPAGNEQHFVVCQFRKRA